MNRRQFLKQSALYSALALTAPGCSILSPSQKPKNPPNVLWIYIEDMNPLLSCYGQKLISTPHMDRLAQNGVLFEKAFVTAPVCSPCRSAIITGVMQTTLGIHNHRSARGIDKINLPENVITLPEIFRAHGYYTYNQGKDDYNFTYDREQLYSKPANWRKRPMGQPFFAQIQLSGGKYALQKQAFANRKWKLDPAQAAATLPPYYPQHPVMIKHWAWHYDAVKLTDNAIGEILQKLETDGLLDNTIIFCFSDHGCYLPRDKQFCYDGGLHVPLLVSYPANRKLVQPGSRRPDLVSLLDISATSLALAGLNIPNYMHSKNLFAPNYQRDYIIAARDRCDYTIDHIRAVRTQNFKYIRNFLTDRPYTQPQYRDDRDYMQIMKQLFKDGKLSPAQAWFWNTQRPAHELYDLRQDPHELNNLADQPEYQAELKKLKTILADWIKQTNDQGQYPESEIGLRTVYNQWKERCVNPEFDKVKK